MFDTFILNLLHRKIQLEKRQKHESSIILFCSIFVFIRFFSLSLLFRFFPRDISFLIWVFFCLLIFNVKKRRRKSFKKWTLILFKLQKITLFWLMNEMICTYIARTRSHHCVPQSVRVCVWNSNINVQCSKFDMLGEQRRIWNVIYFISLAFFFAISFSPGTDRLHLCISNAMAIRCQLVLSTIIRNPLEFECE